MVQVTADDLIDVTNRECAVCLEEQPIGSYACKLSCGHLFHRNCVRDWLLQHCTCPVCRFELQTDDYAYEQGRKKRMKNRKLRFRKDELRVKKVAQLKEICVSLSVSFEGCIDKSEIVDRLIASGMIDITEGVPTIECSEEEFNDKGVRELKTLLLSFGLSTEGALEKSELRSRLLESKRVVIVEVVDRHENMETQCGFEDSAMLESDHLSSQKGAESRPESSAIGRGGREIENESKGCGQEMRDPVRRNGQADEPRVRKCLDAGCTTH
jgi:hypothetical protein